MRGTETVLVSDILIFNVFSIAVLSLLSVCGLVVFWITFRQGAVRYIVLQVKCYA